jgi:hypothetical protein
MVLAEVNEPAGINADNETWSVESIIAAVAWREEAMANCSLMFTETTFIAEATLPLKESFRAEVELHRRDGVAAVKSTTAYLTWSSPQTKRRWESWDGKVARGVYTTSSDGKPDRTNVAIHERMPYTFTSSSCLKTLNITAHTSLSAQIRQMIEEYESSATVTVAQEGGETTVTLAMRNPQKGPPSDWELTFLPSKDFLTMRSRTYFYGSRDFTTKITDSVYTLTDFKQIDGVWIPTSSMEERTSYTEGKPSGHYNRFESRVIAFSAARPTDEQMTIVFPPGVRVADAINKEVYILNPDGSKELQSYYDADTGEMVEPAVTVAPATNKPPQ